MSDPLTYSNFLKADPSASWVDYRDAVKAAVDLEKAHAQAHTNKRHQVISQNRIATLQSRLRGTGFADFEKRKETLMKHASQAIEAHSDLASSSRIIVASLFAESRKRPHSQVDSAENQPTPPHTRLFSDVAVEPNPDIDVELENSDEEVDSLHIAPENGSTDGWVGRAEEVIKRSRNGKTQGILWKRIVNLDKDAPYFAEEDFSLMRSLFLQRGFATGPAMGSRGKAVLDMIKNADTTTLIRGVESLPVEGAVTFLELLKKGLTTAEVRPNLARSLLRSNRRDTPVVRLNLRTDQCFEYGRDREVQLILRMLATTVEMVQWGIPDQTISERTGDACFWRRLVEIVRPDVAVTFGEVECRASRTVRKEGLVRNNPNVSQVAVGRIRGHYCDYILTVPNQDTDTTYGTELAICVNAGTQKGTTVKRIRDPEGGATCLRNIHYCMTKSVEEKLNGTKSMEKSVLKISEHLCPEMLFFNSWVLERYGLRYLSNGIYGLSKLGRVQVPIKLDDQFPLRFTEMCVEVFAFKESIHLMKDLYLDSLDVGDISEQDEDGSTASTYMAPDHAPTPKKKKPGEDHKGARDQNRRELHGDL